MDEWNSNSTSNSYHAFDRLNLLCDIDVRVLGSNSSSPLALQTSVSDFLLLDSNSSQLWPVARCVNADETSWSKKSSWHTVYTCDQVRCLIISVRAHCTQNQRCKSSFQHTSTYHSSPFNSFSDTICRIISIATLFHLKEFVSLTSVSKSADETPDLQHAAQVEASKNEEHTLTLDHHGHGWRLPFSEWRKISKLGILIRNESSKFDRHKIHKIKRVKNAHGRRKSSCRRRQQQQLKEQRARMKLKWDEWHMKKFAQW